MLCYVIVIYSFNSYSNTVGIGKPDMSSFRMVKSRSDMKWSGFRMVVLSGFQMAFENQTMKWLTIGKLDGFVWFSNGQPFDISTFKMSGFQIDPDFECPVFRS